ncbi:MAG TPA: STN domain-containing protein, partial [Solirubrobacterales bacterium]|nr:STN domain-containing protein [Solirubrobacterales bacterium]
MMIHLDVCDHGDLGVEGQVTIELADVPAPEALDRVLAELPSEYVYKMRGSTLIVAAPEKLVEILPACLIEDELVSRPEPPPESI